MQLNECIHGHEKDSNLGEREEDTLIDVDPDILPTMHIYPLHGGLLLISDSELQKQQQEAGKAPPESEQPPTQQVAKEKPFFPFFILILCFFVLFDMSDSAVTNLLSPIATITITPKAETLVTTATLPIVSLQGRVLPVLTLTQSQTTQATGKGHQDARAAAGILTFYNGLFTSEYVSIGTVFTGGDGVQVATSESITIPAASPPQFAEVSVSAYAVRAGSTGNIAAGDINTTIANGVLVKNSQFTEGQDARDFLLVTKADIQHVVDRLSLDLLQSEHTALTAQLTAGEALAPPTCSPTTTADHAVGSEATTAQVTVSQSCGAVAYNQQAVQVQATQILTSIATQQLGTGYTLTGTIQVTTIQATATKKVVFSFTCMGMWVYALTPQEQQQIKHLIAGRTKQDAWQLLLSQQGIAQVAIAGVPDNQPLPQDLPHIRLLLVFGVA